MFFFTHLHVKNLSSILCTIYVPLSLATAVPLVDFSLVTFSLCLPHFLSDMGRGFVDGSQHVYTRQQPSLNTTAHVISENNVTDVVLHIGDISYAEGYASVV